MLNTIEHAVRLYNEATLAEEQGHSEAAESLYLQSREILLKAGTAHQLDAANIMKVIAFIKEHDGALLNT